MKHVLKQESTGNNSSSFIASDSAMETDVDKPLNIEEAIASFVDPANDTFGSLCPEQLKDRAARRDLISSVGFVDTPASYIKSQVEQADLDELIQLARRQPPDPYMGLGHHYRRTLTSFIVIGNEYAFPCPGFKVTSSDGRTLRVSANNLGSANQETPYPRTFPVAERQMVRNRALLAQIKQAIELDPAPRKLKEGVYFVSVFIQGAELDLEMPEMQAAPPDNAHNDGSRMKHVFLLGRHNVEGGDAHFLPAEFSGKPFCADAKKNLLKTYSMTEPGEGYAFLDNPPAFGEQRLGNCHYASRLSLGPNDDRGWRYVATITPSPLLPFMGDEESIGRMRKLLSSAIGTLTDAPDLIGRMPQDEIDRVIDITL